MNGQPRVIQVGQRFRRLVVLDPDVVRNGVKSVRCRCDCGAVKVVAKCNLVAGHSGSCGKAACKRANMRETMGRELGMEGGLK